MTPTARAGDRRMRLLGAIGVAAVTIFAFFNAAPNAFVYDDANFLPIPRHAEESTGSLIGRLFVGDVWSARRLGVEAYRPLTFATIALDSAVHGTRRSGHHATSIALHVAVTVALYFVLLLLLDGAAQPRDGPHHWHAATVAAAIFGVHAIHTESVDCVFNRGDVLVTLVTLATIAILWRALPTRPFLAWGLAAVGYLVALFSKESAATLPGVILAILLPLRFEGSLRARLRRAAPIIVLVVPLALYLLARHVAMARTTWGSETLLGFGDSITLSLTAFRDLLGMVLWPDPLRAVRTDYIAHAVPVALAVMVAYAALVVSAWRRMPGVAAGLLFFAVAVLPSLPIVTRFANAQVIAERYLYLPSAGLAIALAFGLVGLERRYGAPLLWSLGAVLVFVLMLTTRSRNVAWHSDIALFEAEMAAAPGNPEALLDLQMSYMSAGRLDDALALCTEHVDDPPLGLERFFMHCGLRLEERGRAAAAEPYFRKGAGGDAPPPAYYAYGRFLIRMGRREEGALQYERALAVEGDPVRQHMIRAEMLFKLHPEQPAEALAEIDASLALDPSFQMAVGLRRRIVAAMTTPSPVSTVRAAPTLDGAAREALLATLKREAAGTPVWMAVYESDAASAALANELAEVFTAGGWTVRHRSTIDFQMKPGVFVIAAEDDLPPSVQTLVDGLTAAGLSPTVRSGYRAYYAEATRARPGFRGFRLDADQSSVLAIGPRSPTK